MTQRPEERALPLVILEQDAQSVAPEKSLVAEERAFIVRVWPPLATQDKLPQAEVLKPRSMGPDVYVAED